MGKKVLVVTGSPRETGNSYMLAEAFKKGAESAGHEVKLFNLNRNKVDGCKACNQCWQNGKPCVFEDGFNAFAELLIKADVLVLASPVYWGTYPSQMKALIDKMYAFVVPTCKTSLEGKTMALLTCGDGEAETAFNEIVPAYEGFAQYMKWKPAGYVAVPGLVGPGEVAGTDGLERAEALGKEIG